MSKWRTYALATVAGVLLGVAVPLVTWYWPIPHQPAATSVPTAPSSSMRASEYYHFVVDQGKMALVEGRRGENGAVVIQNLDISAWPAAVREMAAKVEFRSLDEVQSFIDSVDEPLWLE